MKRKLFSCSLVTAAIFLLIASAIAQDAPKTVSGGVLNGRAVSLPKPDYPESARAARLSGVIAVNIVIDENGSVISAEAELNDQRERRDMDGTKLDPLPAEPVLRDSAERAARLAKFNPTQLNGQPVIVKGRIVYSFFADGKTMDAVPPPPIPKTINGGVLNGKATSLPLPEYPVAAKAVKAGGAVSIQIVIDEQGNVISASAISGHPLLRAASEAAAMLAKFAPTQLTGNPIKVSGVLTYNFVP